MIKKNEATLLEIVTFSIKFSIACIISYIFFFFWVIIICELLQQYFDVDLITLMIDTYLKEYNINVNHKTINIMVIFTLQFSVMFIGVIIVLVFLWYVIYRNIKFFKKLP